MNSEQEIASLELEKEVIRLEMERDRRRHQQTMEKMSKIGPFLVFVFVLASLSAGIFFAGYHEAISEILKTWAAH